ncbi:MAG TPA: twin-arginine translocase TatA/TatE family subunit [Verrucomicrobiae bacterium]|jgi:sec-independent protein translocase protein TatA|nr:twin-arginine translocase TatA/TatE family subunit [Verrucomicrobiae bacterium]
MNAMLGLFNLGGGEVILIFAVILLLFGAKKLPELAKGLGTGIKEFKKATRDVTDEMNNAMNETPAPPQKTIPAATVPNQTQPAAPQPPPAQKV